MLSTTSVMIVLRYIRFCVRVYGFGVFYEEIWILYDESKLFDVSDRKETLKTHFRIEITESFLGQ